MTALASVDADVIAELEEHIDDTPACNVCDGTATARLVKTCCPRSYPKCPEHHVAMVRKLNDSLEHGIDVVCICGAEFTRPATFSDVFKVVDL